MGLRDRALALQAEMAAVEEKEAAAAEAWEAARTEREQEYLRGLIQPHLTRWCTEMGIDSPTPEFTIVDVRENLSRVRVVAFRFSVDDLTLNGDFRGIGQPSKEEMTITLPKHYRHVGYEINNLNDLAYNLGRPEVRYSSMK
jgi:hypothetical protein